jgi:cyanophycin synthetase
MPEGQVVTALPRPPGKPPRTSACPWWSSRSDGNHGRGVSLDLRTEARHRGGLHVAEAEGSEVIVERFIPGDEHRLLVVGGKLVAAARGESLCQRHRQWPLTVEADRQPAQLRPAPGAMKKSSRSTTSTWSASTKRAARTAAPGPDGRLRARRGRRWWCSATATWPWTAPTTCTPTSAYIAALAARWWAWTSPASTWWRRTSARPLHAAGGRHCRSQRRPGLLMHLKPAVGAPRPSGQAIVEHLFPAEDETGTRPHPIGGRGRHAARPHCPPGGVAPAPGRASTRPGLPRGPVSGPRCVESANSAHWAAAERLLMNRMVQCRRD